MQTRQRLIGFAARLLRDRRGNSAVEMGLILPVLAAIIVPMVDLGMGAFQQMEVQDAAESGAQYAADHGWNQTAIQGAAQSATGLSGVTATAAQTYRCINGNAVGPAVSLGTTCADGSTAGTYVSVSTQAQYTMLFTYPALSNPTTLTGNSMVRIQ